MTPEPSNPANVFRRQGEFWTIVYRGYVCHVRDTLGMRILAVLLGRPGDGLSSKELAGEGRPSSDAAEHATEERARVRATRAIRAAIQKLEDQVPDLAAHLAATVRTGRECVYASDPRSAVAWNIARSAPATPTSHPSAGDDPSASFRSDEQDVP